MQAARKQKKYRIETTYRNNKPISYIVKDVKYKNRRTKVRIYVGRAPPTSAEEKIQLGIKYAYDLEAMAVRSELN